MTVETANALRTGAFRRSLLLTGVFVLGLLLINVVFFRPGTVAVVLLSGLYQGMLFFLVAAGMSIVFGLLKVVVSMKNVSNRNARSTIGVISICVDCFFARILVCLPLPPPPSCCCTSAIVELFLLCL